MSFILIVHNNLFFYKICSKSDFFFQIKRRLYLVTLFHDSLLYKLIQFGMFFFEITLNDFAFTQFLISLLLFSPSDSKAVKFPWTRALLIRGYFNSMYYICIFVIFSVYNIGVFFVLSLFLSLFILNMYIPLKSFKYVLWNMFFVKIIRNFVNLCKFVH